MRTAIVPLMITAAFLGALVVGLVPTASAQGPAAYTVVVTLTTPQEKVKPLQDQISFTGTVEVSNDASTFTNIAGLPVSYKVTKNPPWASVTVSPGSDVIILDAPSSGTVKGKRTFTVTVTASDLAPAFQADTIEITATVNAPAPAGAKNAAQSVQIQADYFSILDVQLTQSIQQDRPQATVTFPIKVTNLGNGATKVNFAVPEGGKSEGLVVIPPNAVTLQSKQAGGSAISAEVPLQIQLPHKNGYMNQAGAVTLEITSNYALDGKLVGDKTQVNVLVTTKGFYVPGFELVFLVGVLGAAAALMRRRT
jgi:hypothetical protein